jgi:hypothetical protein
VSQAPAMPSFSTVSARSENLFCPYAAGVSCFGSNLTGVMRPKISIRAITLPAFVPSSSTAAERGKGFPLSVTKIDRPEENSLSVFAFFDLASSAKAATSRSDGDHSPFASGGGPRRLDEQEASQVSRDAIFVSKKCNVVYIMVNDLSRRDDATSVHLP